jgi:hypothetical protein
MENSDYVYKWIYNNSGQCIMNTIYNKRQLGTLAVGTEGKTNYYYNTDRTLSRIVTHKMGKQPEITMYYSYSK